MKVAYNVQHVIYHHVDAIFRCFSISYCLTIWKIEAATSIPSCRRCQSVAKATFIFYVPEVYWPTPTLFIKYSKHWKQYVISLHIIIPNDFFFFLELRMPKNGNRNSSSKRTTASFLTHLSTSLATICCSFLRMGESTGSANSNDTQSQFDFAVMEQTRN